MPIVPTPAVRVSMATAVRPGRAPAAPAPRRAAWTALRALFLKWSARRRLGASIAHLDDRLLADAGLKPTDRGLGDRLIRHFVAGSEMWSAAPPNVARRDRF
jgi:uncharacterized protein YjiS (DUF1127 family)